jgi:hypothetical protein
MNLLCHYVQSITPRIMQRVMKGDGGNNTKLIRLPLQGNCGEGAIL